MSERGITILLKDIQVSISNILDFTKGYTFNDFEADLKTRHAVERDFEIIGEAVSRIPDAYKEANMHIEWRIIKDFRNFIIHEYFGIDNQIVWDTIQYRLPDLLKSISLLQEAEK
jgi:uncharacterized protein with HEPN domain